MEDYPGNRGSSAKKIEKKEMLYHCVISTLFKLIKFQGVTIIATNILTSIELRVGISKADIA